MSDDCCQRILILAAAPTWKVELAPSPQYNLSLPANRLNAILPGPIQFLIQFVSTQIVLNVSLTTAGERGPIGPPGPSGPRGSLFLGGYPSFANLPVPNGDTVRVGDFALVQDESAIYELE